MKNKFRWYLPPSEDEVEAIWKDGILTIDANVLLDLYRYHESTRTSLLNILHEFKGRLWVSHQAATEFFKNRTKVIVVSEESFRQAEKELKKLQENLDSSIGQLKGNHIIPEVLLDGLKNEIEKSINDAKSKIKEEERKHPKFLHKDPLLERLLDIFEGVVGNDFGDDEKEEIKNQAKQRVENKVPPGYMDDGKDGDRAYGDYYLWQQILKYSKEKERPIIMITSERKDDWWERISGKTIGPRKELVKEAMQFAQQRILIYRTEYFMELVQTRSKQPVNKEAIEEIKTISSLRMDAVKLLRQDVEESSIYKNKGLLAVTLQRPVRNFTVSGNLRPNMFSSPLLNVRLLEFPNALPSHKTSAGTGTLHDFNIHIISKDKNILLPVGEYIIEYEALSDK